MRRFVLGWKMLGLERSLGTRIVTYADDLVILFVLHPGANAVGLSAWLRGMERAARWRALLPAASWR